MEGYIRGAKNPDPGWWMDQIHAAEEFRRIHAKEQHWDIWRAYYRGEWKDGVIPVNLFFTLMRTIVPRVYFRNPSVSVQPSKPGPVFSVFAKILERVDNKMLRQMRVKQEIKQAVQDAFMFGTGIGKLGFGAEFTPTPDFGGTAAPIVGSGNKVEYRDYIYSNMPWFGRVKTGDFLVPDGCDKLSNARFVVHRVIRALDDVKSDTRFSRKARSALGSGNIVLPNIKGNTKGKNTIERVALFEVRDKKTGRVFVLAPTSDRDAQVLFNEPDELIAHGFNFYPLIFNPDDEVFWGVPDSVILDPQQREINEIRTQIMRHRRLAIAKLLVQDGFMEESEMTKMLSEDAAAVVRIKGDPRIAVRDMQIATIPRELFLAAEEVMRDVRETVGFSRNQFGEFASGSGDTTATEAQIVRQASEIRIDERRDMIADMLVDMIEGMHNVIFRHWGRGQVVDVVGPGGVPIWVEFSGEMLEIGQYSVKVDPDNSAPDTKLARERRAIELYGILKQNPLIDPQKLTQYLLHEIHGVQFDDMMRMLPPPEDVPAGPIPVKAFSEMIGRQAQRARELPGPRRDQIADIQAGNV